MTSCYREFNQKSKGNKGKKEQQQQLTLIIIRLQNIIFKIHSYSLLAPYFSFPEFAIDFDTVSRHNIYAEDTTTSQKFFVYEITRGQDFYALQSLLSSKSRTVSLNWDNSIKVKPCNAGFVWCLFVCRFFIFLITDVKQLIYLVCKKVKSRLRFQCLL